MHQFNTALFIVLNNILSLKSLLSLFSLSVRKVCFAIILKSKYLLAFIVFLQRKTGSKINTPSLQHNLITGNILRKNLKIGALIIIIH